MNSQYYVKQAILDLSIVSINKLYEAGMSSDEFRSYDLFRPNFWTRQYTNDQVSDFIIYLYDKFFWKPRYRSENFVRLLVTLKKALVYASTHPAADKVRLRPSEITTSMWSLIAGRAFLTSGGNEEALRIFANFKVPVPADANPELISSKRLSIGGELRQYFLWCYAHNPESFRLLRSLIPEVTLGYCQGVSVKLIVRSVDNLQHLVEAGLSCDLMNQMGFFRIAMTRNIRLIDWLIDNYVCYSYDPAVLELPITQGLRIDHIGEGLYNKIMKHIMSFIEAPLSATPRTVARYPQRAPREWIPFRKIAFSQALLEYSLITGWYTRDSLWSACQELDSQHELYLKEFVQNFIKESIRKSIKQHQSLSPR